MEQGTTREEIYRFVGSTTPVRHLLQSAVGLRRLVDQLSGGDGSTYSGRSGPVPLIVDTPGFVSGGVAEEFQYNLLELLRPTGLILLGEEPGVERIAANFANERNMELRRLERSPAARERNQEERRRYRVRRYEEYFGNAEEGSVELAKIGLHGMIPDLSRGDSARNLLCALCDGRQNVASLVVAGDYDDGVLRYWGPPVDSAGIANLQFGTLRLDRATFREY
jgi:polynucleotide 5'-hydroxyl-kinase GRC3/NOL9